MGDNIWLPDRDGVRTPMQWDPDRNAGFSNADPGRLYLPPVQSLAFDFRAHNVEVAMAQPDSLLHWLRGMLATRRAHPVFGLGDYSGVTVSDPAVLAFLRVGEDETVLCVNNLSAAARRVNLHLPGYGSRNLVDLVGGEPLGHTDRAGRLDLTLGCRQFYWLRVAAR